MLAYHVILRGQEARAKCVRVGVEAPESGWAPVASERLHEGRANAGRFERLQSVRSIFSSISI
jgi:hypothetical protein